MILDYALLHFSAGVGYSIWSTKGWNKQFSSHHRMSITHSLSSSFSLSWIFVLVRMSHSLMYSNLLSCPIIFRWTILCVWLCILYVHIFVLVTMQSQNQTEYYHMMTIVIYWVCITPFLSSHPCKLNIGQFWNALVFLVSFPKGTIVQGGPDTFHHTRISRLDKRTTQSC